jgi:hypothetical protein
VVAVQVVNQTLHQLHLVAKVVQELLLVEVVAHSVAMQPMALAQQVEELEALLVVRLAVVNQAGHLLVALEEALDI